MVTKVVALVATGVLAAATGSHRTDVGRIAFTRGTGPDRYSIWTVRTNGSRPRQVTHACMWDWWPAWSPDRRRIAFSRACANGDFDVYVAGGGRLSRLTRGPQNDTWPTWSPDGRRIAFVRGDDRNAELYVAGADGGGLRRLTHNRVSDDVPAWSPDGKTILFTSRRTGRNTLMTISPRGGGARSLGLHGGEAAWSPDGRQIAFARGVAGAARETADIYIANASGSDVRRLTHERSGVVSHHPSWAPDGSRVVFMSNRAAPLRGSELWVVDVRTGTLRRLTHASYEDADPAWQ